jgi:hypothetical protein
MFDTRQIADELDTAYEAMLTAVENLDEHQFSQKWVDGHWGIREIVAFHTYWFGKLGGGTDRLNRGERPTDEQTRWEEMEGAERVISDHVQGKTKEEVLFEFNQALDSLKNALYGYQYGGRLEDERIGEVLKTGLESMRQHTKMLHDWMVSRSSY